MNECLHCWQTEVSCHGLHGNRMKTAAVESLRQSRWVRHMRICFEMLRITGVILGILLM